MLKSNYAPKTQIESIYTGGVVQVRNKLYTQCNECIYVTELPFLNATPAEAKKYEFATAVSCFYVHNDILVCALQNQTVQILNLESGETIKSYKCHDAPVLCMAVWEPKGSKRGLYLATGSADSTIQIYDLVNSYTTHVFKGHGGVVTSLAFGNGILASGSLDGNIKIWDLYHKASKKGACITTLSYHTGVIRSLHFIDENTLVSQGRDRLWVLWDWKEGRELGTFNSGEVLESMSILNGEHGLWIITGGESGVVKVWNQEGDLLQEIETGSPISFIGTFKDYIYVVSDDQTIQFLDTSLEIIHQVAGYNDEILDLKIIDERYFVCLTNTNTIRVYEMNSLDCLVVKAHEDIVLTMDIQGDYLVTGSKDKTFKVWKLDLGNSIRSERVQELLQGKGHNGDVNCVKFTKGGLLTGSSDRTVKFWSLTNLDNDPTDLESSTYTFIAHEKDITSIDIAPNNAFFATSSLDKLIKIWDIKTGNLMNTFKGHRRGVWNVKFSKVDQVLVSCSTDKTIKVWNMNGTCVKTLQGHLNTVLNFEIISNGMQILSSGADASLKLWNLKSGECTNTFENHESRIWGLSVSPDEKIVVSGSSDSTITIWKDTTEEDDALEAEKNEAVIKKTQELELVLRRGEYKNALIIAIELNHPLRALSILSKIRESSQNTDSISGSIEIDEFLTTVEGESFTKLIDYVTNWNTHTKYLSISQPILKLLMMNDEMQKLNKDVYEKLSVYVDRHASHLNDMIKDLYLLEYTLHRMSIVQ